MSQTYVSLLESDRRPVPEPLVRKLVSILALPASTLPVSTESAALSADGVARALGTLGSGGFAHLGRGRKLNPVDVLVRTLSAKNVEARLAEALPWLLVSYPKLDWPWLMSVAKQNDVQNRLGFVVTVARELAEKPGRSDDVETLRRWEGVLENSRLQKEDAFSGDAHRSRAHVAAKAPGCLSRWTPSSGNGCHFSTSCLTTIGSTARRRSTRPLRVLADRLVNLINLANQLGGKREHYIEAGRRLKA